MAAKVVIEDFHDIMKNYDPTKNVSRNILTKYEKTSVIGLRAEQLQRGAEPLIEYQASDFEPIKIANKELEERKLPFMICRTLPNGQKEYWRLQDMIV